MITNNPMQLKAFIKKESSRETYFRAARHAEIYAGAAAGTNFSVKV